MEVQCNQASATRQISSFGLYLGYVADQDLNAFFNRRKMITDQSSGQYSGEIDHGTNQSAHKKNCIG